MLEIFSSAWNSRGVRRLPHDSSNRPFCARVEILDGYLEFVCVHAAVNAEQLPEESWRELTLRLTQRDPEEGIARTRFPVSFDGARLEIGSQTTKWSRLEETAIRRWYAKNLERGAFGELILLGRYIEPSLSADWPTSIWRGRLEQRGGVAKGFYGYLVQVQQNKKDGRPWVIIVTGRKLPDSTQERAEVWETVFASATPETTAQRRDIGRTQFIEAEPWQGVGTSFPTLSVGPRAEEQHFWTPHYRWIVQQWFSETLGRQRWSLELVGKVLKKQ